MCTMIEMIIRNWAWQEDDQLTVEGRGDAELSLPRAEEGQSCEEVRLGFHAGRTAEMREQVVLFAAAAGKGTNERANGK